MLAQQFLAERLNFIDTCVKNNLMTSQPQTLTQPGFCNSLIYDIKYTADCKFIDDSSSI
jgi:hypothetical protein